MLRRDIKGIIGGVGLAAVGLFAVWYGQTHYQFGGVHNMGPGFLPVSLGVVLALLGMCIAIPAWFRSGEPISTEWGSAFFVIVSIAVFGGLLASGGLVVATLVTVLLALVPERKLTWGTKCKVALGIALIAYLIFSLGLGMAIKTWPWSG
ncbi:tripartite tricarboxylate transporter TctB family protein [Oceanimonas sp. MB9]|uniref:tripartite tricarboxylate transporter TctB family protein n=1 Tax=Oceanimonas sp. MB9 TaxID=2588453 RepID=UPI0013F63083|nr:tripartite tricarboxylate transporter TctB family protein [Oceanimonas sp. MB9]NHI00059.1 hypothetical protein [Oceanimonas sp. MB9]